MDVCCTSVFTVNLLGFHYLKIQSNLDFAMTMKKINYRDT